MPKLNKNILLGITGGIAAYKSIILLRELIKLGAKVKVVLTKSGQEFVSPLTLQALSNEEVRTETFDLNAERAMSHIELAKWADYLIISPASANFIAKMSHGLADCLLSTLYLATENTPTIVCPAMNRAMWLHPATQKNCQTLKERNVLLVGPDSGDQACGDIGPGRLIDTMEIINAISLFQVKDLLKNHKVVITAGPTQEAIDPVRYLTNHSSGKMGYALANAAIIAGAQTTLISGPTSLSPPANCDLTKVTTAKQMLTEVLENVSKETIFISCAAVSDYTISEPASQKLKKTNADILEIKLTKNPDILKEVSLKELAKYHVGFAAETCNTIENAKKKLVSKKLDMIIANQVGENLGFNCNENSVTILTTNQEIRVSTTSKINISAEIIKIIAKNLGK